APGFASLVNRSLENPMTRCRFTEFTDLLNIDFAAAPSLSQMQKANVSYIPPLLQVLQISLCNRQPIALDQVFQATQSELGEWPPIIVGQTYLRCARPRWFFH